MRPDNMMAEWQLRAYSVEELGVSRAIPEIAEPISNQLNQVNFCCANLPFLERFPRKLREVSVLLVFQRNRLLAVVRYERPRGQLRAVSAWSVKSSRCLKRAGSGSSKLLGWTPPLIA